MSNKEELVYRCVVLNVHSYTDQLKPIIAEKAPGQHVKINWIPSGDEDQDNELPQVVTPYWIWDFTEMSHVPILIEGGGLKLEDTGVSDADCMTLDFKIDDVIFDDVHLYGNPDEVKSLLPEMPEKYKPKAATAAAPAEKAEKAKKPRAAKVQKNA